MHTSQQSIPKRKLRAAFLTPSLHIGGAERWILSLARNFQSVQPAGVVVCAPHHHPDMLEAAARLMPVYLARKHGDAGETRRLLERACITADVLITWGVPRLQVVTQKLVGRANHVSYSSSRTRPSSSTQRDCVLPFEDEKTRTKYEDEELPTRMGNPPYIPIIDVSHSDGAWTQQTKMVHRAASGADFHVAVSRSALRAFPPDVRRRAMVIYNGVEVDRVTPRVRSAAPRGHPGLRNEKTALFLGRFEEVKGFDRLFEAAEHLPSNWKIIAHGHGSLQSQIQNQKSQIQINPPLNHIGDALAAADILVMPSRHEGMPLTLIEAWLAGTPVAATPFGFVQEAIEMHGPLCEVVPQDPTGEALAAGIVRAAEGKFVEEARRVAWNHYTAGAMAQRWEEYLYEVINTWTAKPNKAATGGRAEPASGRDHRSRLLATGMEK